MGKRVIELLVSDLSGAELEAGQGETIEFSYRGKDYTIDLTDAEAEKFDKAMEKYLNAATKVSSRRSSGARRGGSSGSSYDAKAVRAWANENGIGVPARGRIPGSVVEQYNAAH